MSLQVHAWRAMSTPATGATNYISPINGQIFTATELLGSCYVCAAGTFSNWQIVLPSAPGVGRSFTFTLRVNGVDTGAAITIADAATSGTYTGAPIALADGDKITIRSVPAGTPTASALHCAWSFNSTTPNESIYGSGGVNGNITTTRTNTFLFRPDISNFQTLTTEVLAAPGTITKITIEVQTDSGGTGSWTFTVNKNGVAQDGSGGTPDTRIVFNNTGTVKSATFSMAVAAGDRFSWSATPTGTPAATRLINGMKFVATNPGESQFGGVCSSSADTVATEYVSAGNGSNVAPTATEADWQVNAGLTPFRLKNLYVGYSAGVGAGAAVGYTLNLRRNGAGTSLSASVLNNATDANDLTGTVAYGPQDLIGMESVPQNTPTARVECWCAVQTQLGGGSGGGNSNSGKKGGGGGVTVVNAGGAAFVGVGNVGVDVGITS